MSIISNYPLIQQLEDNDCGVAVTQAVLLHYEKYVGYAELASKLKTNGSGTKPEDIISVLEGNGIECVAGEFGLDEIMYRGPVIVLIQCKKERGKSWQDSNSNGHYCTVIGVTDRTVSLHDPSSKKIRKLTYREMLERWHDVGYYNYAIITKI